MLYARKLSRDGRKYRTTDETCWKALNLRRKIKIQQKEKLMIERNRLDHSQLSSLWLPQSWAQKLIQKFDWLAWNLHLWFNFCASACLDSAKSSSRCIFGSIKESTKSLPQEVLSNRSLIYARAAQSHKNLLRTGFRNVSKIFFCFTFLSSQKKNLK